jgi:hypothetical protein
LHQRGRVHSEKENRESYGLPLCTGIRLFAPEYRERDWMVPRRTSRTPHPA